MRARLTALIAGILFALPVGGAFAAELGVQRSSAGGVTVVVTPPKFAAGAKSWDFKVVLDTHSADLSDDLVKTTVLLDGTGGKYAPVAWDGAAPGGHHREGVLRFKPLAPRPQAIELRISRPGEAKPRVFSWRLK